MVCSHDLVEMAERDDLDFAFAFGSSRENVLDEYLGNNVCMTLHGPCSALTVSWSIHPTRSSSEMSQIRGVIKTR